MKTLTFWSLIVINVVLGSALLGRYGMNNTAVAQVGRPSEYIMITGEINGNANSVVYLLDTTSGQLGAMIFDPTRTRFDVMQPIDLNRIFDAAAAGGTTPPAPRSGNPRAPR